MTETVRRALLVGHFSTFGDIEVLEVAKAWLRDIAIDFDVSPYTAPVHLGFSDCVNARRVDPQNYSHLIVVCGPHSRKTEDRYPEIFGHFDHAVKVGLNLSVIDDGRGPPEFDYLFSRDGADATRPDASLLRTPERQTLAGLCFVHPQPEYGGRGKSGEAETMLRALVARKEIATIRLETAWPPHTNSTDIPSPAAFNEICARLDVLLTTRLHGLVLGLRAGIPVIALDSVAGGDKVSRQAESLEWPEVFRIDTVTEADLDKAYARCLSGTHVSLIRGLSDMAQAKLSTVADDFSDALLNSHARVHTPASLAVRLKRAVRGWNHERRILRKASRHGLARK